MLPGKQIQHWTLTALAVVAAGWLLSAPGAAWGQYQIDNYNGHMLDASNRIGSGGYNSAGYPANTVNSNDIYLGNVTGYGGFKGAVPDKPPQEFQGYIPPQPSLILQQQAGLSSLSAPSPYTSYNQAQPYYNQYTAPGANIPVQEVSGTNSYFAAPAPYRQAQDYRLGATLDTPTTSLPAPGEIVGPGQVDLSANTTPTFLNNAPLYGITALNQPASALPNGATGIPLSQSGTNLANGLSQRDILRLRSEMAQNVLSPTAAAQLTNGISSTTANGAAAAQPAGAPVLGQISGPISLGTSANVTGKAAVESGQIVVPQGDAATGQSVHQYIPLPPPPAEQSPQYAKLRELLQQYQSSHPKTDEEASRLFQQALQARREYEQNLTKAPLPVKPAENGQTAPKETTPTQTPQETEPTNPSRRRPPLARRPDRLEGIRAAGLSQLVAAGRRSGAASAFQGRHQQIPRRPPGRPQQHADPRRSGQRRIGRRILCRGRSSICAMAFTSDPALLMGKYDLTSEIGDDRLQSSSPTSNASPVPATAPRPCFCWPIVSYNMGDTDKAVGLSASGPDPRRRQQDELIRSLGEHWSADSSARHIHSAKTLRNATLRTLMLSVEH
jgi:hypothetical protein